MEKIMTKPKRMDIKEFREFGFLQEVNRCFFHPLGLALEVYIDEETGEVELGGKMKDFKLIPFDPNCPPLGTLSYGPIPKGEILLETFPHIWYGFIWKLYILRCVDLDVMLEQQSPGYPLFNALVQLTIKEVNKINGIDTTSLYYLLRDTVSCSNMYVN